MKLAKSQSEIGSNRVVAMDTHALGTLRYIRETMNTARSFSSVPGSPAIAMGCIGIIAAVIASQPEFAAHWMRVWLLAACIAVPLGFALLVRNASKQGVVLYRGVARRFLLCLSPALVAAAALTLALAQSGVTAVIPGTWILLYGAGISAASLLSIPLVGAMGLSYMLLGTMTLFAPSEWSNILLGIGFGGLHIFFGVLLARRRYG
ncbi:MAG: hypothetical protein AAF270_15655 [Pseudomonadota bacterium]